MNWKLLGLAVLAGVVASVAIWAAFALPSGLDARLPLGMVVFLAGVLATCALGYAAVRAASDPAARPEPPPTA